jgi:SAM-dependent methyltransferase
LQQQWFETFFQGAAADFWIRAIPPVQTLQECDYLQRVLEIHPGDKLLDVPCGHGRHAIELARRGYRVTGVDLSRELLDRARESSAPTSIDVDWRSGDMRDLSQLQFEPAGFDAAYCFGNSFGYLDHAGAGDFLSSLAHVMEPGGLMAIDTGVAAESILPTLLAAGAYRKRWHRLGDLVVLSEARYAAEASRLDIDYTFIQNGSLETRLAASYVFTIAELRRMLEHAGFAVTAMHGGFGCEPYEIGSPRLVLIARR